MSPAQDKALKTKTRYFGECSHHVYLKKYKQSWEIFFFITKYGVILAIMVMALAKSDKTGPKKKVCFWRIVMKSYNNTKKMVIKKV